MPKFAIRIAYDGTDFCGWQTQRGTGKHKATKTSIQSEIVAAIDTLCGEKVTIVPSGRTDAGVHANGQIAHFSLKNQVVPEANLLRGINHLLPDTIEILNLEAVDDSFRAQSSKRKQYSYYFLQGPSHLPHLRNYVMWNRRTMAPKLMQTAIQLLVGSHDFKGFSSSGANVSSTTREIYEAEVTSHAPSGPVFFCSDTHQLIRIRLVGSGFLKQMVRTIAGTLQQIGEGQTPVERIAEILNTQNRQLAGPTAPAGGLWLDQVWYDSLPSEF